MVWRSVRKKFRFDRLILRSGGHLYFLRVIVTHRVIILTIKIPNGNSSEYVIISVTPFIRERMTAKR